MARSRFTDLKEWIGIPQKRVRMSAALYVEVPAFRIAREPVTVREFAEFVAATGYRTTAELNGGCSYCTACTDGVAESDRPNLPASCLSLDDAEAFCAWSGTRLPSEAEWLAAAILDWDLVIADVKEHAVALHRAWNNAIALHEFGLEWTRTKTASGTWVMRSWPTLVLDKPTASDYRAYLAAREFSCETSVVRVCAVD